MAGAYYWLLTVGEGLFDFYTSCHVNYVNLDICIEGGKRRGGVKITFHEKKNGHSCFMQYEIAIHKMKMKGVQLPVGIKSPGVQNDD